MASDADVQLRTLSPRPTAPVIPSPARDSLRGNLKAAENDSGPKKRKSWFGSMRDVFHKSALQAKTAVDSMRGEGVKHEDERKQMIPPNNTPEPRDSCDSATSTTPLKSHTISPQLGRRRTFSPKEAVYSVRHHLQGQGSRHKRGSLHTIIGRTSTDVSNIPGPGQFVASPKSRQSDEIEQHRRKSSVAGSLVGSIRGLGRRPTKSKTAAPVDPNSPEEIAEGVPLPSSPISIPSAAPVLGLDLGQPGMNFIPAELAAGQEKPRDEDMLKLRNEDNFAFDGAHKRNTSLPLVPDEIKMLHTYPAVKNKPTSPREMLLQLPTESLRPSPPRAPTTPLPGTNFGMELDGSNDSEPSGKKSQVFERSVTSTTEKDRKELRTICSLDAMAEACKSATNDSAVSPFESVREEQSRRCSAGSDISPLSNANNPFISPRPSVPSASTVSRCPSDMPALERMTSDDSSRYQFESSGLPGRGPTMSPGPIDDPFDDRYVATHGPPSPARSVKLPLRLKIKPPSEHNGEVPSEPMSPEVQHDIEHYTFGSSTKPGVLSSNPADTQQYLQRNYAVPHNLSSIEQRPQSQLLPQRTETLSDDDNMARAQSLRNSDVVYPDYEYPQRSDDISEDGMSPHGGPIVPNPLWHGEVSPNSRPGRSTWKAGLGEGPFKFSIDNWRSGTQPVPDPQPLSTPKRKSVDMSIDSVSADESWETPLGSRASNHSERTPSMGNPLDFQLKRSSRNMRYNALHQEHPQQDQQQDKKSSSPVRMQARFTFGGSSGDMDPNEAQYYPDYSTAYASPAEGTPKKGAQPPVRVSSEDSITMSLRSASDNMERLAALLGRIDSDDEDRNDEGQIYDAFTTASSPRSKQPLQRKDRGVRSDSPSPERILSHPLPATPVLGPQATSPNARNDPSHNSFTVLDLELEMMSPPHSGDTATAELITAVSMHDTDEHQHGEHNKENRIVSGGALDRKLDMLSSPDSGYNADESSVVQTPEAEGQKAGKQIPRRYRSQSRRQQLERKVLGATKGNTG